MRTAFGLEFDVPDGYLNTASIGIPPAPVADAVAAAIDDWRRGAVAPPSFDMPVATARAAFGQLVGAPAERVAIGATVSGMLGQVAAAVEPGKRVVVPRGEFTSVTFPFAAQVARGVVVDEVDPAELATTPADVVALSVAQSADGAVADLDALKARQAAGTTVVLDVSQALGWMDLDLGWADVVVGAGYKWLMTPRGASWMAVRPELTITPHQAGWYAGGEPWSSIYGLPLRLATDARGLDISPAWYSHVGAAVALPWLAGLDRPAVQAHCVGLADALRKAVGMEPAGSAIVSVQRPGAMERLQAAGITASVRAGGARLAFHLYNTEDDLDRAVDALA